RGVSREGREGARRGKSSKNRAVVHPRALRGVHETWFIPNPHCRGSRGSVSLEVSPPMRGACSSVDRYQLVALLSESAADAWPQAAERRAGEAITPGQRRDPAGGDRGLRDAPRRVPQGGRRRLGRVLLRRLRRGNLL